MPKSTLNVELLHWRDRRGRFAKGDDVARDRLQENTLAEMNGIARLARDLSPVGTADKKKGELRFRDRWRASFTKTATGGEAALVNEDPKAAFVIYPTRPHVIRARYKKALRFQSRSGATVFARSVHHPGTKGNDVLAKVQQASEGRLVRGLQKAAEQASTYLASVFD